MNYFIFHAKLCSRGFLYPHNCIIYYNKYDRIIMIIHNNRLKVFGYLISLDSITGFNYDININIDMKIILETDCNNIYFEYNPLTNSCITINTKKCYYYIIGDHSNMMKLLNDPNYGIIDNSKFKNMANDGLPYWCVWIDFFDHDLRILYQHIMIYIEFCMFIWSIYQIFQTFPDLILLIKTFIISLHENYKNTFILIYFIHYTKIPIALFINIINTLYEILIYPFQIINNYIRVLVQLKIISLIDLNLFRNMIQNITNIINNLSKLLKNSKIFITSTEIYYIKKKIPDQISHENLSYLSRIKGQTIFIWKFCFRPIKYVYDVIKAPLIGEFGRKIRSKLNNTQKINKI